MMDMKRVAESEIRIADSWEAIEWLSRKKAEVWRRLEHPVSSNRWQLISAMQH